MKGVGMRIVELNTTGVFKRDMVIHLPQEMSLGAALI